MRFRLAIVAGAVIATAALPLTASAAVRSSVTKHPVTKHPVTKHPVTKHHVTEHHAPTVKATASPVSVAAAGGKIKLALTLRNATSCTFSSRPAIAGFAGTVKCSSGSLTRTGTVSKDTGTARSIRLIVKVKNATSSVTTTANIAEAGTKKPTTPTKKPTTPVKTPATTTTTPATTTTTPATTTTTTPAKASGATTTTISPAFLYTGPGIGIFTATATVTGSSGTINAAAGQVGFTIIDLITGVTLGTYYGTAANPEACTFTVTSLATTTTIVPSAPDLCTGPATSISAADDNAYGLYAGAFYTGAGSNTASTSNPTRV